MRKIAVKSTLLGLLLLPAVFGALLGGCKSGTGQATAKVEPAGFRADPSKMTDENRRNMEKLMKGSGKPPTGAPAGAATTGK